MKKNTDKVQKTTPILNEDRLNQLKQLFPECLTEGEVDVVKVMELLNVCKAGGGEIMMSIQMFLKNDIALHGPAKTMLFASLTYPPRLH